MRSSFRRRSRGRVFTVTVTTPPPLPGSTRGRLLRDAGHARRPRRSRRGSQTRGRRRVAQPRPGQASRLATRRGGDRARVGFIVVLLLLLRGRRAAHPLFVHLRRRLSRETQTPANTRAVLRASPSRRAQRRHELSRAVSQRDPGAARDLFRLRRGRRLRAADVSCRFVSCRFVFVLLRLGGDLDAVHLPTTRRDIRGGPVR